MITGPGAHRPLEGRLSCPVCRGGLDREGDTFHCESGHGFDIAKQGYVNLIGPEGGTHTADTREMLAARHRVLEAGLFDPLAGALTERLLEAGLDRQEGLVLDIGCGTGHYLDRTLEALPRMTGIGLDNSKLAARQVARRHPRAGAVVADIWDFIPLRDSTASLVLDLFAPRNPTEIQRVTAPGGLIAIVTASDGHLAELTEPFSMISVEPGKSKRLERGFGHLEALVRERAIEWEMNLFRSEVEDIVAMGPSGDRLDTEAFAAAVGALPERTRVSGRASLWVFVADRAGD